MAYGLTDRGAEFLLGMAVGTYSPPDTLAIGLYSDADDNLDDSAEFANANSEPTGVANYQRETPAWPTEIALNHDVSNSRWEIAVSGDLSYDVADISRNVDGWLMGAVFNGENDDSPTLHLLARMPLEDPGWPSDSGLPTGVYPLAANEAFILKAGTVRIAL